MTKNTRRLPSERLIPKCKVCNKEKNVHFVGFLKNHQKIYKCNKKSNHKYSEVIYFSNEEIIPNDQKIKSRYIKCMECNSSQYLKQKKSGRSYHYTCYNIKEHESRSYNYFSIKKETNSEPLIDLINYYREDFDFKINKMSINALEKINCFKLFISLNLPQSFIAILFSCNQSSVSRFIKKHGNLLNTKKMIKITNIKINEKKPYDSIVEYISL